MAGSWALENEDRETPTSDPCDFICVPLSTTMAYVWRTTTLARKYAESAGYAAAHSWAYEQDELERKNWVTKERTTDLTLGQIISRSFEAREACWTIPTSQASVTSSTVKVRPWNRQWGKQKFQQWQPKKQHRGGKNGGGKGKDKDKGKGKDAGKEKPVKDGKCHSWNTGGCTKGKCPMNFHHLCNRILESTGKVCGGNHRRINCDQK